MMFEAVILGIIQGLTEFLPVSSTAHLILTRWFLGWEGVLNSLSFDVALHIGTFLSLLICFWKDILLMAGKEKRLLGLIVIGTVPAGAAGFFGEDFIEHTLRSPYIIAITLTVFGLVMLAAERFNKTRGMEALTLKDALIIGSAQAIALIPGVSRSGITISAGLMLGFRREASARFAFLLSMPAVAGAAILEGRKLASFGNNDTGVFLSGLLASLIAGVVAIKFLLSYLKRHPLNIFSYYRFMLAVIISGWLWLTM